MLGLTHGHGHSTSIHSYVSKDLVIEVVGLILKYVHMATEWKVLCITARMIEIFKGQKNYKTIIGYT